MRIRLFPWSFCFILASILIYSHISIQITKAQTPVWKSYTDPSHQLSFSYPSDWQVKGRHDNITGSSKVILIKPNSTRTMVSILSNTNDTLLINSKSGKTIVPSKGLTNLEKQISIDFVFFNSTGKFPHKYTIHNHQSASDIVDFEKNLGKPGKMLIVFSQINDNESCTIIYSESKRLFYKNLSNISEIIKSIQILS